MRVATFLTIISLTLAACVDVEVDEGEWGEWGDEIDQDADDELGEIAQSLTTTAGPIVTIEPGESTEDFANPERGYYRSYHLRAAGDATPIRNAGYSLAIAIVKLEDYRDRSLDAALLTSLENGFARARAAGIKLIVRFTYNDSSSEPDASKSRVLSHINQLTSVLRSNADVIAVLQAGFIGAWGEWHGSTNGLDTSSARAEIFAALLSAMPSSRSVQVRTPMFKNAYRSGAVSTSEAYSGSSRSRIGHHNDCFLASASDLGTFASPVSSWMSYLAEDTRYVPMGGETCRVYAPRTDCPTAIDELERFHWSYLNREYHGSVIAGWGSQGCDSSVKRRLGYRFVLRRIAYSSKVAPGGVLGLEVDIRNKGFAALYNQRPLEVVLKNGSVRHVARLEFDPRRLAPGEKTTVTAYLRVPANLAPGTYSLALRMPDAHWRIAKDPRYAIRFANAGVWDAATGDNVLTTSLAIDPSAPGAKDPSATTFAPIAD